MKILTMALTLFSLLANAAPEVGRQSTEGYVRTDLHGRTFFIRHPGMIEKGVMVKFESARAERMFCKLQSPKRPLQCPKQKISFIPGTENHHLIMAAARIEDSRGAWHRLKGVEEIFKVPPPPEKK